MSDKYYSYKFLQDGQIPVEIALLLVQLAEKSIKALDVRFPEKYLEATSKKATLESVKFSNEIEGIRTTDNGLNSLLFKGRTPKNQEEKEILGYFEIFKEISDNGSTMHISVNAIKHIHEVLEKYNDGYKEKGEFKTEDNAIVGYSGGHQYIVFEPVSAKETSKSMDMLCEAFREAYSDFDVEPLLLIPCFILDFLCIHPFADGNGRTSRLITDLLLLNTGHDVILYHSLDKYIFLNRQDYYSSISKSNWRWHNNSNNYFPFMTFFLKMLLNCYWDEAGHIHGFKTLKNEKRKLILEYIKNSVEPVSKDELINNLRQLSVSLIQKELYSLLNVGIIVKIGNYRNARYKFSDKQKDTH